MTKKLYRSIAVPADVLRRGKPEELAQFGKHPMSPKEQEQRLADEKQAMRDQDRLEKLEARRAALSKRWPDAFSLLDEIIETLPPDNRVRRERARIKSKFPKPMTQEDAA